jgi:hypothetical protein
MICGLLKQIIISMENVPDAIIEPLIETKRRREDLELKDAFKALSDASQTFDKVYICVDALDECEEDTRWSLIDFLQKLASVKVTGLASSQPQIRFLFTGRPQMEAYVKSHPSIRPLLPLPVKLEANSEDIVAFVQHRIEKDTRVMMTQGFKDHIVAEITSKSQGMFVSDFPII